MTKVFLSWQTPEYFPKARSNDWFWAVGIISAALVITAVLLNNILLAVFLVIATFAVFMYAKKKPEVITVQITEDGVRAGQNMYPYSLLKAFDIKEVWPTPTLWLQSESILNPIIEIPIVGPSPEKVRETIGENLPEEEVEEPLTQKILEYLGF